ncbi:hypothetical protein IMSHALPRED_001787 [Imshaugia aleurites]|uniref:GPR1/FUN34/yaaH family-domain-containing protein n=1 Tax=Imshaugia aleurites TaxID=172621 RepID=A0A8H3J3V1_9LECA|nr:hypothetical protein IMSHALPRED_001787 [Imshaugia aleurites]
MSSSPSAKDDIHCSALLEAQHPNDSSQPGMPIYHRRLANPAPLGLLSFATSVFLVSLTGMGTRGVEAPNIIVTTMICFGGICQYIAGIMEFVTGNTLGATVFSAYAGFNVAYALIFIPSTGVLAACTDMATGKPLPELDQALALLVWAWFILSVIFTVAATRASWSLLLTLVFFDLESMLLAVGYTVGNDQILIASRAVGFVVSFCAYWSGTAGLWGSGATVINLPTGDLSHKGTA